MQDFVHPQYGDWYVMGCALAVSFRHRARSGEAVTFRKSNHPHTLPACACLELPNIVLQVHLHPAEYKRFCANPVVKLFTEGRLSIHLDAKERVESVFKAHHSRLLMLKPHRTFTKKRHTASSVKNYNLTRHKYM